jgi:5-formyltetrahydrofolate cyclo-ligase
VALSDSSVTVARRALRATLRAKRRAVPPDAAARAATLVARHADRTLHLRAGQRIALYASLPEELDTAPLIELARRRGCRVYLPRIERQSGRMRFAALTGQQRVNRLGILEPEGREVIGARWLDIVFLPLVGFDAQGMRLGMGGGYYDRAFAFRHTRRVWRGPKLVGLAYDLQRVPRIESAAHDVPLDAVITEKGYEAMNPLPHGVRDQRTPLNPGRSP